ncbi:hypothetical protein [Azospirillum sp. B510]|uniref:hypothetical protein n=1 Tax=Azospirillum sp. (strain B510) TaxID=137722 RepID=UPI0011D0A8D4|nr:hypothetical protein [Azospirillum sp. B510]
MPDLIHPFHREDVPEDILQADMAGGYPLRSNPPYWGGATIPNCVVTMMGPGIMRDEAASVDVPVFFGVTSGALSSTPMALRYPKKRPPGGGQIWEERISRSNHPTVQPP